jgi:formiminotetrahydrofolate cyclodeaminase
MTLADRPLVDLLAAFRSPSPTPGGGSASALAGAIGTSLLAMVGSMPRHRAASEEDVDRLQAARRRCVDLGERLVALADRDSQAYDEVMAAYKLPKGTDAEKSVRSGRIQQAMATAIEVPLEIMRRASEAIEAGTVIATFGNVNAASDVGVALELLTAAHRGARLNVDVNLRSITDAEFAARARKEADRLQAECDAGVAAARADLGPSSSPRTGD